MDNLDNLENRKESLMMESNSLLALLEGSTELETLKNKLSKTLEALKKEYEKSLSSSICLEQREVATIQYEFKVKKETDLHWKSIELLKKKILEERFQK